MDLALTLALVAAILVTAWRRISRNRSARAFGRRPGASRGNPCLVRSFKEIDEVVGGWSCSCGRGVVSTGESPVLHKGRELHRVRVYCSTCEEGFALYFDLSRIPH